MKPTPTTAGRRRRPRRPQDHASRLTWWRLPGLLLVGAVLLRAATPAAAFDALPALSYYMDEAQAAVILTDLPEGATPAALRADVSVEGTSLVTGAAVEHGRYPYVAFPLRALAPGPHRLEVRLRLDGRDLGRAATTLARRAPQANAVQVDRLSGGLVVDGLPFVPAGFYCYSPVQPTLAAEEATRGFNLMSPYQANDPAEVDGRRAWMDAAAALGLKVHYQLLSVAGGGGVTVGGAPADTSAARRRAWLRAEVEAFRDHPALLAWYISDEPTGHGATPKMLMGAADVVRELDPYHPVTVVFMNPGAAGDYADAMDLAMTDPYPIPNGPAASAGDAVRTVWQALAPRIPVWLVPQAFGGNEWWSREPTARELRLMSWLGFIEGATGMQYFIRHGLNGFPKSPDTWAAAGRVALEAQALTPFLLSRQARPAVATDEASVRAAAWRHGQDVLVAVANTENRPVEVEVEVEAAVGGGSGAAAVEVLYEDRTLAVEAPAPRGALNVLLKPVGFLGDLLHPAADDAGAVRFEDMVDALGVRLYRLTPEAAPAAGTLTRAGEDNLLLDSGFEWDATPGVPAAVYADVGQGRGATYFVDTRVAHGGEASLRLQAPTPGSGVRIRPYAPTVTPGRSYRLSVWARAAGDGTVLRLWSAASDSVDALLTRRWARYDLDAVVGAGVTRAPLAIGLASAGTAWIDDLSFFDISPHLEVMATPLGHSITVTAPVDDVEIRYRTDGGQVDADAARYAGPVHTEGSSQLRVALMRHGQVLSRAGIDLYHHAGLGRFVDLAHPYSPRYAAGGPGALADGILGTDRFADGRWQGFEGDDLIAVVDLGRPVRVDSVRVRFLQSVPSWIWLPRVMEVNLSDDGLHFRPYATADHDVDEHDRRLIVRQLVARSAPDTARYVRVRARSMGTCPAWHPGAGGPAWVFADEIRVDGE